MFLASVIIIPIHTTSTPTAVYAPLISEERHSQVAQDSSVASAVSTQPTNTVVSRTSFIMVESSPTRTLAHIFLCAVIILLVVYITMINFLRTDVVTEFNYQGCDADFPIPEILIKEGMPAVRTYDERMQMTNLTNNDQNAAVLVSPYTLIIKGLPSTFLSEKLFMHYIRTAIDPKEIAKVSLVLDVSKIIKMQKKLAASKIQVERCEIINNRFKDSGKEKTLQKTFLMKNHKGQFVFRNHQDALQYWSERTKRLQHKVMCWNQSYHRLKQNLNVCRYDVINNKDFVTEVFVQEVTTPLSDGVVGPYPYKHYPIRCSGFAYVVFKSVHATRMFRANYKKINLKMSINDNIMSNDNVDSIQSVIKFTHTSTVIQGLDPKKFNVSDYIPNPYNIPVLDKKDDAMVDPLLVKTQTDSRFIRIRGARYEPQDVNWNVIFGYKITHTWHRWILRAFLTNLVLFLLLLLFSTPYVIATFISNIAQLSTYGAAGTKFQLDPSDPRIQRINQGSLYSFIFVYLPTLMLFFSTMLCPLFIHNLTYFSKLKTNSFYHRAICWRIYGFLLLSTLILPTLFFSYSPGFTSLLLNVSTINQLLSAFSIPTTGVFFINYILQKALLKNAADLMSLIGSIKYVLFVWYRLFGDRRMTTREHLDLAEGVDVRIEREYAYITSIMGIALVFSVISPLVLAVCLLYLLVKYYVDRYALSYIYGHRKKLMFLNKNGEPVYAYGAMFGMKTDYVAHKKQMQDLCYQQFINLMCFTAYLALLFGTKAVENSDFSFHFAASLFMLALCTIALVVYFLVNVLYVNGALHLSDCNTTIINPDNVNMSYQPPHSFLSAKNNHLEDKPQKEKMEEMEDVVCDDALNQ
ncbi:hypothetical protein AKO1_007826 [Acrasis kona]|uniref:Uncharacterized protein n=1 Tax=Acrasis kona TaxID=1008807 RepID=A0AAW2YRZ3_9EUKA